jgi:hypothetical protein
MSVEPLFANDIRAPFPVPFEALLARGKFAIESLFPDRGERVPEASEALLLRLSPKGLVIDPDPCMQDRPR